MLLAGIEQETFGLQTIVITTTPQQLLYSASKFFQLISIFGQLKKIKKRKFITDQLPTNFWSESGRKNYRLKSGR